MRTILFDMDDTLAATATLWKSAESRLLRSLNHAWTEELARRYKGMNAGDVAATVHRLLAPDVSMEECQHRMRSWLLEAFADQPPQPMPGAVECVRRVAKTARLAVASGSPREAIQTVMRNFDIERHFAAMISSESVPRGKPHPDVFLAAAKLLDAAPGDCLVIEDSFIGVQAALAAGMKCCAVPSDSRAADQIRALGARVLSSLHELE